MQIVLLSGGSGSRLWPLSNDARSKQFLKLLDIDGSTCRESMVQRVLRQLKGAGIHADITVATGLSQKDSVISQLGSEVSIVIEPSRRDTFPAICLACEYLSKEKHCPPDEVVVVMPCDPYTEIGYFECIKQMAKAASDDISSLIVMGITPTYPSSKYGYVIPDSPLSDNALSVLKFTEKPDEATAHRLIEQGAKWNGGVFAFKLGYMTSIAKKYVSADSFNDVYEKYQLFPRISFDYEVAEKATSVAMIQYNGLWKDLGTWNTLTDNLRQYEYGNVITDGSAQNTHIFNELSIPLICLGTKDLVVAASPDGILVTDKAKSEVIKKYVSKLKRRPMYEERRWGTYKVVDSVSFDDGYCSLTKQLTMAPGASISYQRHTYRTEVWTFINGEGEIVINGERRPVRRGETVIIPQGALHGLRATTSLTFIEVQSGSNLIEEDIERFQYDW